MRVPKAILLLFVSAVSFADSLAQIYYQPNMALKSHETLEILNVTISEKSTLIYLNVENRISGGNFCADRNIYLVGPDGKKIQIRKSTGIAVCPDIYKFKTIGEKLQFTLEFPPLQAGTKWIDIVEDCSNNCFWFYGVTLDIELNKRLDQIFLMASKGKPAENISLCGDMIENIDNHN